MSALSEAMEAVRTFELSQRPVFAAEPQVVDVTVMPGTMGSAAWLACRFCVGQVVVYESNLRDLGKVAKVRGWVYRKGLGWLCPGCEGLG